MEEVTQPATEATPRPEATQAAQEPAKKATHEIIVEDAQQPNAAKATEPKVEAKPEAGDPQNQPEESADSDETDAQGQPAKKNRGVGKRIDELTKEKYDALRERDHWREMAMKGQKPEPESQPAQMASTDPNEPTLESCDFDVSKFNKAWYAWQRAQERQQEQAAQRHRKFMDSETAFRAEHPDYDAVAKNPELPITAAMAEVIADTDNPPALAYYLGQNPQEAAAIAQMDERAMGRAIGRIEARLSAPPAPSTTPRQPEPKPVTPFTPVTTLSGAPAVVKSYEDMSQREYEEQRRRDRQARGLR